MHTRACACTHMHNTVKLRIAKRDHLTIIYLASLLQNFQFVFLALWWAKITIMEEYSQIQFLPHGRQEVQEDRPDTTSPRHTDIPSWATSSKETLSSNIWPSPLLSTSARDHTFPTEPERSMLYCNFSNQHSLPRHHNLSHLGAPLLLCIFLDDIILRVTRKKSDGVEISRILYVFQGNNYIFWSRKLILRIMAQVLLWMQTWK